MHNKWVIGVVGWALIGCRGPVLEVGGSDAASSANGGGGAGVQTWSGYLESFKLPSGSDHITLKVTVQASGTVTGTVLLGDLPLLPPPTDPEAAYPSLVPGNDYFTPRDTIEHFEYAILNGRLESSRLTFDLGRNEPWKVWCEIQTKIYPLYNGTPERELLGYGCLPNTATGSNPSGPGCVWEDKTTNQDV